jgi:outer membrane lipoprotein
MNALSIYQTEVHGMSRPIVYALLLVCIVLFPAGCTTGISQKSRTQINYTGPFSAVQAQPETYTGKIVMWGGRIVENLPKGKAAELVVLQLELKENGYPIESDKSEGRFLVRSDKFLDPAIYYEGALITVVGRLEGSETQNIGEMPYVYPVVSVIEIKKWVPGEEPSTRFMFGIGIGAHF